MATTKQLMNKILVGLRQTQIDVGTSSITDAYETLLLQYLNEAKEEVEESWDWYALRTTVTVTVTAAQVDYTLTDAGDADVDTTERTKLLYERSLSYGGGESSSYSFGAQPQVFDVTDDAEYRLGEVSQEAMERFHFTDSGETGDPQYFSLYSDGVSQKMKIYPTPAETRTLKVRMINPQAELSSTDLTTVLKVPSRPVWTKALYKANEERGEEIARPNGPNAQAASDALAIAISREQTEADYTGYPQ